MNLLLLANLATTLFMTGVAWFVQVVHYPLLGAVGDERFGAYHAAHQALTSRVVVPVMLLELAVAIALVASAPPDLAAWSWLALGLLAVVWASTFGLQVPAHRRLAAGFAPEDHRRLVTTSWLRTGAWSARAVVLLAMAVSL